MKSFNSIHVCRFSETGLREVFFACYFAFAFGVLLYFSFDDSFCFRPGARNYWLMNGQLAAALATYSFVVSFGVGAALSSLPKLGRTRWLSAVISALVVGFGVALLPFWIYEGYGHFRFEGTWGDVSCYFTEGFGLMFSFVVAPLLAVATFVQEIAILKLHR
jgi:hypothetical protein